MYGTTVFYILIYGVFIGDMKIKDYKVNYGSNLNDLIRISRSKTLKY
jgi:hypothetical protein